MSEEKVRRLEELLRRIQRRRKRIVEERRRKDTPQGMRSRHTYGDRLFVPDEDEREIDEIEKELELEE